ncbi:MAG: VgrG-related protein [Dehalococcoidia bacterium]
MPSTEVDVVQVKVDQQVIADNVHDQLALVSVEESVALPDQFRIHFYDPLFELFDRKLFKIGSKVQVAFRSEGQLTTVIDGEVTTIKLDQGQHTLDELVIAGFDLSHRLHKQAKSPTFLKMSDDAIVRKIAGENGLQADVDSTGITHDYLLQRNQTDYEFLRERADRNGFDFWVTDRKLFFKKKPQGAGSPPKLEWGQDLINIRLRLSAAERADEVTVKGWTPLTNQPINGNATNGSSSLKYTTATALKGLESDAKRAFGTVKRTVGHVPVVSQEEANALAESLLRKASGGQAVLRGEAFGNPNISAGVEIEVTGVGEQLSGRYTLTSVEHLYGAGLTYTTRFVAGDRDPASLIDLLGGSRSTSLQSAAQGWGGLLSGIVTNSNDPENLGRVKVKLASLAEEQETDWARVVSPGGGGTTGFQSTPEVGDEVLVGFEFGDMRRPVVIGGLWNKQDAPPTTDVADGKVRTRVWQSRTGHKIEMIDDDSNGSVSIVLKGEKSSVVINQDGMSIKTDKDVTIEGKKVQVTASSDLSLKGQKVLIEGSQDVTIKGTQIKLN